MYALCALPCAPGSAAFVVVGKGYGRIFRVEHHASSAGAAAGRASDVTSVPLKLAGREKVGLGEPDPEPELEPEPEPEPEPERKF